ncbi:Proclotting enzyme [Eumeta japonica]|uniref:Proclotting enzyme n=1 Tax=Eumeta variegata TaxID=151549 RepID=A0A4C1SHC6_EUMVA|nr:Proclotting enzyme [Eumeta japonica]
MQWSSTPLKYNARNSAALNFLRMMQCADSTLPDPPFFTRAFLFYAIATISWLTSQRQNIVHSLTAKKCVCVGICGKRCYVRIWAVDFSNSTALERKLNRVLQRSACAFVLRSLMIIFSTMVSNQRSLPTITVRAVCCATQTGHISSVGGAVSSRHLSWWERSDDGTPLSYVGRIEPAGSELQLLQDYNRGRSIGYRIHFPVTSPLPRLTDIFVNDNLFCQGTGDTLTPGRYVTTIRLRHTLYLKSGSLPANTNLPRPTGPAPAPTYPGLVTNNRDSVLYTFTDANFDDNRNGVWSSDVPEIFTFNTTRPISRPTPPQNPVYEIYPDAQQPQPWPTPFRPQPEQTILPQPAKPQSPPHKTTPTSPPKPPAAKIPCGVISGGNERIPLIFNGQSIARGDWPWLVAIYKRKDGGLTFICSGTLISERHIVSDESNEPKLDGVAAFNYGVPMATSIISSGYHIAPKYSSRRIKRAQTRWVASFNYGVSPFLPAPSSDSGYHIAPNSIIRLCSPPKYCQDESNEPKLDGLRRLITEFLWPPSSSIIRLWLPYSTKVLIKTNQTSPNSMGLRRLITSSWPPSSSIIRLWLPYSTKVLGRRIKRAQTRWGCVV